VVTQAFSLNPAIDFFREAAMTALITGASSGLGAEFAKLFAKDKHDLILVARRKDRLDALAKQLAEAHGISARTLALDLGVPGGAAKLIAECANVEVEFLVNNAGFGGSGAFAQRPLAREIEMIDLNVRALVELTHAFVAKMLERKRGRVLNIGSTAGFQPGPFMAVYYASKAFVNSFTEALAYELKGTGVTATVSCPGATATEFANVAGNDKSRLFAMGTASAEVVARQAYRAMMKGKPMIVHGAKNKFALQSLRVSPRATIRAIAASLNARKA
jgi:short-subunit dehydrogenase